MANLLTFILGLIIFFAICSVLNKGLFDTVLFNETIRKNENFQLIYGVFLIIWVLLTTVIPDILKDNFNLPRVAWISRGTFFGLLV